MIVGGYKDKNLKVEFSQKDRSLRDLLEESDAAIGYNSIALFEARAFNKRAISLKAGPMRKSLINAMNAAGIDMAEMNIESISGCLNKDRETSVPKDNLSKGGIENCVRVIKKELSLI